MSYSINRFQKDAERTICDRAKNDHNEMIEHGILGITGEVGELATALERWKYYGHELDKINIQEEVGDCLWYLAEIATGLEVKLDTIMKNVIDKLRKRYPEKYDSDLAKEENRNRQEERKSFEPDPKFIQTGQGWAEPPYLKESKSDE